LEARVSDQDLIIPFSMEPVANGAASGAPQAEPPSGTMNGAALATAIETSGLAVYHWNIETDRITWSGNTRAVLDCEPAAIATGRLFATFLDPDNFTSRYDTVLRSSHADEGAGVAFQIEYKFRPEGRLGRASLWLEDDGRWFADAEGKAADVYGAVRRIDDRHMRDQQLSFLGNCDPLTGMMNRGRMMEALSGAMSVAGRDGTSCAFLIAAINNLSVVNDAYGFEVADEVIIAMGRRLRQVVRTGDAIARYSGSKFGVILNGCGEDDLAVAAERFLSVARESVIETARGPVWALLSIGALLLPRHAADPHTAVARAEEALTEVRKLPSDGFVVYKPSPQRSSERSLNAHSATEIVRCLREDNFRLAFQPVVDATTRRPRFHEALLRMTDGNGQVVAAGHLIPIAEKLGLVRLIDRAVVQMVVGALHKFPEARLSVNISGTTATDPRWHPHIIEILDRNREVADRLIIEITETVALGDLQDTARFAEQLRELGCHLAIDDFGAGYTSFRNLRAMPVDVLKLDGTFCSNLAGSSDNRYFVRSLIDLARTFNMRSVAEWVETEEDAELLASWGVDMMQGNLFGGASLETPWKATGGTPYQPRVAAPFTMDLDDMDDDLLPEKPQAMPAAPAQTALVANRFDWQVEAEEEAGDWENAAAPAQAAIDRIDGFEDGLVSQLAKLRLAIEALDKAFKKPEQPASADPSYADLVSETVLKQAG
jgi:diguanylate cyclase (GGDEF)-like protein